jgi:hypothetical protein
VAALGLRTPAFRVVSNVNFIYRIDWETNHVFDACFK